MITYFLFISTLFITVLTQNQENTTEIIKFLLFTQRSQDIIPQIKSDLMNKSSNFAYQINIEEYVTNNFDFTNTKMGDICEKDYNIILDVIWNIEHSSEVAQYAEKLKMLYLKVEFNIVSTLKIIESYVTARKARDIAILFENTERTFSLIQDVEIASRYWINNPSVRVVLFDALDERFMKNINESLKIPSFYILLASTQNITIMLEKYKKTKLMKFPERIILTPLDFDDTSKIKSLIASKGVPLIKYDNEICCQKQNTCDECSTKDSFQKYFLEKIIIYIVNTVMNLKKNEILSSPKNNSTSNNFFMKLFYTFLKNGQQDIFIVEKNVFTPQLKAVIEMGNVDGKYDTIARYNLMDGLLLQPNVDLAPAKRFYRIGTGYGPPWVYFETDPKSGVSKITGFCIDLLYKLAEEMRFDFEIAVTKEGYGYLNESKIWTGLIGTIVSREIDIAVSPMTITAQRAQYIDFVYPAYATTGLTIVIRKPVKTSSLFKFFIVFDLKIWLMLMSALIVMTLMLFLLDYFSPQSSRNRKYTTVSRRFHFVECFWFSLTCFTPLGGGEPPKSLSGRILVASYWIFVGLMLITFTSNLSAFLTAERIQSLPPVFTLDQLIGQSRINYTVVKGSWTLIYFENMYYTEKYLYSLWKKSALNRTTNKYRLWDYPIKDTYFTLLKTVKAVGFADNDTAGLQTVLEHTNGDFALIHDYNEIRYAMARTCNLVEVGNTFAERSYGLAVQQGSDLREELGNVLIRLKRQGYLETLKSKYWNVNLKQCPEEESEDGITVDSLGGMFIVVLAALIPLFILVIIEIINKKKLNSVDKIKRIDVKENKTAKNVGSEISLGSQFEPVMRRGRKTAKYVDSEISLGSQFEPIMRRGRPFQQFIARNNEPNIFLH